jgi:hypothetical protein
MKMSTEVFALTENQINQAFERHDFPLLEKETLFVLNNFVLNLSDTFSNIFRFVKPIKGGTDSLPIPTIAIPCCLTGSL